MNKFFGLLIAVALTLCSMCVIVAAAGYYLIATPTGGKLLVRYALLTSAEYASVTVDSFDGTIARGLVLKDVEIKNCPFLGPNISVRLQRVDVGFPLMNWRKIWVNVFNGRLYLPNSDPMVFNGSYAGGTFQGSAYTRSADVSVVMRPFMPVEVWRNLHGIVSDADLKFQGTINNPSIKGYFTVDRIEYMDTIVRKGFAQFDLSYTYVGDNKWRMQGPLTLENGVVNIRQRLVDLQQSRAMFKGNPENPQLSIHGTSKVDEYTLDITIGGTLAKPIPQIRSDPYLPDDMAYMMMGLGNWEPSNSRLPYDADTRRMGLKKRITDDMNVGFALEEPRTREIGQQQSKYYSKMIEGELSLTDKFSLNFSEEIFPRSSNGDPKDPSTQNDGRPQGESMLYLQYKNKF